MKNYIILFILIFFASTAKSQNNTKHFNASLKALNLAFTPPKGYNEIDPIKNSRLNYEKAYKHPTKKFEVRYATRKHKITNFAGVFRVTVVKIADEHPAKFTFFTKERVREKYNGDVGGTIMVDAHKDFAPNYKYCLMICVNKKGVGDALIFFLADDLTLISNLSAPLTYTLKFKK